MYYVNIVSYSKNLLLIRRSSINIENKNIIKHTYTFEFKCIGTENDRKRVLVVKGRLV